MRVLVVDDEMPLAEALARILTEQGHSADIVNDGASALTAALAGSYDVIILDVMLPEMDGLTVCRRLREAQDHTPALMLTARDELQDKIAGLDCGADDYMTKPFAPEELLARLRALTRRQGEVVLEELTYADLQLGLFSRMLTCGAKSVHLGFKEFDVLRVLMSSVGTIVSKDDLLTRVWGGEGETDVNSVEAYISFLRKKLFYLNSEVSICTVRKVGYYLDTNKK